MAEEPISRKVVLGRNLVRLRTRRRLTQEKLAEITDVDRRYIQRIERGRGNPGVEVLAKLKTALRTSWKALLD